MTIVGINVDLYSSGNTVSSAVGHIPLLAESIPLIKHAGSFLETSQLRSRISIPGMKRNSLWNRSRVHNFTISVYHLIGVSRVRRTKRHLYASRSEAQHREHKEE